MIEESLLHDGPTETCALGDKRPTAATMTESTATHAHEQERENTSSVAALLPRCREPAGHRGRCSSWWVVPNPTAPLGFALLR
jgi:hypothetical protein